MRWENGTIRWGQRLRKVVVRRLYKSYMAGFGFEELLDDIGTALYIRCSDIMYLRDAREGTGGGWRCLPCESSPDATGPGPRMKTTGRRDPHFTGHGDELFACPICGWEFSFGAMRTTFRNKQLHSGGAVDAFEGFVKAWPAAVGDVHAKMRAVDMLIHSFHYSLRSEPDLPIRAAGVNLIEGRLKDVLAFLDALSSGRQDEAADRWRAERRKQRW
ncbi:MAG: hypothetical protein FWD53_01680 [Phycisphaerales bacterium]|nr:hypothetical protein [Phycisphaerales bacterium]